MYTLTLCLLAEAGAWAQCPLSDLRLSELASLYGGHTYRHTHTGTGLLVGMAGH